MTARPTFAGSTDVGRVRSGNEDAYLASPPLFAVADGLGGHQAGEVASRLAIEALREHAPRKADAKALGRAARAANRAIIDAAAEGRGRSGMGTTLTAVMVDGLRLAVAHVGDSRAYLLRRDRFERITQDHSMVADMVRQGTLTEEESRVHPNRSVITRALGSDPNMAADTFELTAEAGDRLLLCTDGLTSMVSDAEIERILASKADPGQAVAALIGAAKQAGGHDNVTVVVVDLGGEETEPGDPTRSRWAPRILWLVALLLVIGAAVGGTYGYARSRAFVRGENGVVVIYRGVPGSFAGVHLAWREETTDVAVDRLPPILAQRLQGAIPVDGVAAARALVDDYRSQESSVATPSVPASGTVPATGTPAP